jgi:hypothetical protein
MELLYQSGRAGKDWRYTVGAVRHYIDDFPALCIASERHAAQKVLAALWKVLGYEPQGKKVWFEGEFETV